MVGPSKGFRVARVGAQTVEAPLRGGASRIAVLRDGSTRPGSLGRGTVHEIGELQFSPTTFVLDGRSTLLRDLLTLRGRHSDLLRGSRWRSDAVDRLRAGWLRDPLRAVSRDTLPDLVRARGAQHLDLTRLAELPRNLQVALLTRALARTRAALADPLSQEFRLPFGRGLWDGIAAQRARWQAALAGLLASAGRFSLDVDQPAIPPWDWVPGQDPTVGLPFVGLVFPGADWVVDGNFIPRPRIPRSTTDADTGTDVSLDDPHAHVVTFGTDLAPLRISTDGGLTGHGDADLLIFGSVQMLEQSTADLSHDRGPVPKGASVFGPGARQARARGAASDRGSAAAPVEERSAAQRAHGRPILSGLGTPVVADSTTAGWVTVLQGSELVISDRLGVPVHSSTTAPAPGAEVQHAESQDSAVPVDAISADVDNGPRWAASPPPAGLEASHRSHGPSSGATSVRRESTIVASVQPAPAPFSLSLELPVVPGRVVTPHGNAWSLATSAFSAAGQAQFVAANGTRARVLPTPTDRRRERDEFPEPQSARVTAPEQSPMDSGTGQQQRNPYDDTEVLIDLLWGDEA